MNGNIRKIVVVIGLLYVVLFARLNWIQAYSADELNHHKLNSRLAVRDYDRPRGDIITAEGVLIAHSEEHSGETFTFRRTYPEQRLFAHVAGYLGFHTGSTGVERVYADDLAGKTTSLEISAFFDLANEQAHTGTVQLSVRADVQRAARDALGDRRGSVVVLDPRTGAVIAMWSYPSFDPEPLASGSKSVALGAREELLADPAKPLLARAYRETFAPGSTFKVVTAAAAIADDKADVELPDRSSYLPPSTTRAISNFGDGESCGGSLSSMLAISCNTGFAELAAERLGPEPMVKTAQAFGWNAKPPIDLPDPAQSSFPVSFGKKLGPSANGGTAYENSPKLAQAGIGQGDVTASPLTMAMTAAAIGNGGQVMTPHVAARVLDGDGQVVRTIEPKKWKQAISADAADALSEMMVGVVADGTASSVALDGWRVGAKTGTAQTVAGQDRSHAWMIAFAGRNDEPASVAISVLVEAQDGVEDQTGSSVAGPIARDVMEVALGTGGN